MPASFASAHALIINERGEIALVKEREHKSFNLPGGQRQDLETAAANAAREISEETGFHIGEHQLRYVENMIHLKDNQIVFPLFIVKLEAYSQKQVTDHETIWVKK